MPKDATTETSKAAVGYDYCTKLFALEKRYAALGDEDRRIARQVKVEPLLEAYWCWLKTVDPTPGSKLAEAVTYALNQKSYLNAFLEHGEVDISNNFAENAIRRLWLAERIGCSAIHRKVRMPAPWSTRWWKRRRPTVSIRMTISYEFFRSCPIMAKIRHRSRWICLCPGTLN